MSDRVAVVLRAAGWPARTVLIGLIRLYGLTLAGLMGGRCRFHPSCSAYAEAAFREAGAVRGAALAVWRVVRCSPLSRGGVDLPPRRRAAAGRSFARSPAMVNGRSGYDGTILAALGEGAA